MDRNDILTVLPDREKIWLEAYDVRRDPPAHLDPAHAGMFAHEYHRRFGPVKLSRLTGTTVTADGILMKSGRILPQNLISPEHRSIYGLRYVIGQAMKKKRIRLDPSRRYALCFDYWSNVYYHWICDALPRFFQLQKADPGMTYLVPEAMYKGYVKQSLEMLGITNVQTIPPDANVVVPELFVMGHIASTGNFHPSTMNDLRDQMLKGLSPEAGNVRALYASRSKASYKFIVNETEVTEVLKEFHIGTCYFEDWTFQKQVATMQGTNLLIGMHGANLTNMLFMPPKSTVLEFREFGDSRNNCFYALASALGHTYYCQFCKRGERIYDHYNRFDLVVDIAELRTNLGRIFSTYKIQTP